ncbi:MAG: AzlD domain-containing protein [Mogibacterium sp.]|nr:AzlD domain-containing protein [Mogibacterium sp.]
MSKNLYIYIYIFVMAFTTWLMRIIPSLVMKKPIQNRFIRSFLYYVPYVTLAVMTFPAIMDATQSPVAGLAALVAGVAAAWMGVNLFGVAVICCIVVFLIEMFI